MKILVVEDHRELAQQLTDALSRAGYTVHMEFSASAALAVLPRFQPDLVIADLYLDQESGLDLIAPAKAAQPSCECILATANPESDTAARAMDLGAYEYISKPYSMHEIQTVVQRIRDRMELVRLHPSSGTPKPAASANEAEEVQETLAESEIRTIREALTAANGNKARAAKALGISRRRLYSRMKILGLDAAGK